MATKKPWEMDYETSVGDVRGAPSNLATQGVRPWEMDYAIDQEQMANNVPTQRIRAMAQGATLGGSDELEAYARNLMMNEPVDATLADIRSKLQAYRQARPGESLAFELGGSIPTAMATSGLASALPIVQRAPMLGQVAVGGGLTGGLTGLLSSENEGVERLRDVPVAAAAGTVFGPAAYYGVKGGGAVVDKLLDVTRRAMGGRGAKVVETELQRLASESGLTTDEIVGRVARGEIMAENETLRQAVRLYYQSGGPAAQTIATPLKTRPEILRQRTMGAIQRELSPSSMGNILKDVKLSDDQIRIAERAMYEGAYKQGGVVTKPLLDSFTDAMRRSPTSSAKIGEYYLAQSGKRPFFTVKPDGNVEFSRMPTLEDMEIVRRGIKQEVDVAYRSGAGATGEVLGDLERALRAQIDEASPAVSAARSQAATTRSNRDMFKNGTEALTKSADQVDLDVSRMTPAQLKVYRSGVMSALRAKATTGGKNTLVKNIADPASKEGQILRTIFPADQLDSMLELAGIASRSKEAANTILGGSSTFANFAQQGRVGSRVSAEEVLQFGTNPVSTIQTTVKAINNMLPPGLTADQRNQVARILVSEDPNLVRNALTDNSLMAQVQAKVEQAVDRLARGAAAAATYTPAARIQGQ